MPPRFLRIFLTQRCLAATLLAMTPALLWAQSTASVQVKSTPPSTTQDAHAPATPQVLAAPGELPLLPRQALVPFRATYDVARNGSPAGTASMQVIELGGGRWRLDLGIRGTKGLAGIAGLNLQQSTVFERVGDQFKPISQSTVQNLLFSNKRTVGVYDWAKNSAIWTGDISKKRSFPVPLQMGDMNTLLVNIAVVRDAAAGKSMTYRIVDNGRMRQQTFVTSAQQEMVTVADLSYDAWRVTRINSGKDGMEAWVSDNVPTPVRIVQTDNDTGTLELTLVDYKGPAK